MPLRGELWWADLDPVVGRELGRKVRPVLLVSYDEFAGEYERVIVVPSTTQSHDVPCHVPYQYRLGRERRRGYLCCEDVRSISTERLKQRFAPARIERAVLEDVERWLRVLMVLDGEPDAAGV
jgi:mRNA interferase MazF